MQERPVYLDLTKIKLPMSAFSSITHRLSGMYVFFISLPLYAQSSFKNKDKRASLVKVAKVQYFNIAEKTESIGRLVAVNPTIISSKINQEILKIHFNIGDNVKKNDVLFTLDSKDILRNIEQISAEMKYEKETLDIL